MQVNAKKQKEHTWASAGVAESAHGWHGAVNGRWGAMAQGKSCGPWGCWQRGAKRQNKHDQAHEQVQRCGDGLRYLECQRRARHIAAAGELDGDGGGKLGEDGERRNNAGQQQAAHGEQRAERVCCKVHGEKGKRDDGGGRQEGQQWPAHAAEGERGWGKRCLRLGWR